MSASGGGRSTGGGPQHAALQTSALRPCVRETRPHLPGGDPPANVGLPCDGQVRCAAELLSSRRLSTPWVPPLDLPVGSLHAADGIWEELMDLGRDLQPEILESVEDPGPDPARKEPTDHTALGVDPRLDEPKDVLHGDHVFLHSDQLADLHHLAGAVPQPFEMHDDVDRTDDLGSDRAEGDVIS